MLLSDCRQSPELKARAFLMSGVIHNENLQKYICKKTFFVYAQS